MAKRTPPTDRAKARNPITDVADKIRSGIAKVDSALAIPELRPRQDAFKKRVGAALGKKEKK